MGMLLLQETRHVQNVYIYTSRPNRYNPFIVRKKSQMPLPI